MASEHSYLLASLDHRAGAHNAQRGYSHHQSERHEPHKQSEDGSRCCGLLGEFIRQHAGFHAVLQEGRLQAVGGSLRVHAIGNAESVARDRDGERKQVVEQRLGRQHRE